jgi:hypothetical protein
MKPRAELHALMAIILHQLKAVARKLARFVAQFFWHFRRALLYKHIAQKQGDPTCICSPKWSHKAIAGPSEMRRAHASRD